MCNKFISCVWWYVHSLSFISSYIIIIIHAFTIIIQLKLYNKNMKGGRHL